MEKFDELIRDQFEYGGKKYALNNVRESTDELFDKHGKNWLFGTMDKYTYRFQTLGRERDILKIATYAYIVWLKRGYFVKNSGLIDVLDTTVKVKSQYFNEFLRRYNNNSTKLCGIDVKDNFLRRISLILHNWSTGKWEAISEFGIFLIFHLCFLIWLEKFSKKEEHDTDTFNKVS